MTIRDEFLNELERLLKSIPEHTRKEWLYDYYIHFEQATENGQSEEEAARELGDPRLIAGELLLNYRVEQAETSNNFKGLSRAVFATIGLGLFNIIFIIGPYVALAAVLLSLWVTAAAVALSGFGIVMESMWSGTFTLAQAASLALILFSIAILLTIGLKVLTKQFFAVTLKYLKFNTRIVRGTNK